MKSNELLRTLDTIREKDVPIGNKQVGPFLVDNFDNSHWFNNWINFLNISHNNTILVEKAK